MRCLCHSNFFGDFIPYLASCKCHSFLFSPGMNKLLLLTGLELYECLAFKLGYQLVQDASCSTLCNKSCGI